MSNQAKDVVKEPAVEQALKELREMFPEAAFLHAGGYTQWRRHEDYQREYLVQIEGRGFRDRTLKGVMGQVRVWKELQS